VKREPEESAVLMVVLRCRAGKSDGAINKDCRFITSDSRWNVLAQYDEHAFPRLCAEEPSELMSLRLNTTGVSSEGGTYANVYGALDVLSTALDAFTISEMVEPVLKKKLSYWVIANSEVPFRNPLVVVSSTAHR
jgi:hypothetical protein